MLLRVDPENELDLTALDPARPQGQHPRPRDRQVQRRLHLRRAEADPAGRQAAHRATGSRSTTSSTSTSTASPTPSTRSTASTSTSTATTSTPTRDSAFEEQYAEIDIEAGYQRLCGYKALQYVRYRHEDNDIVRSARQQTFLREARQKVPPRQLLDDRDELIDIFKKYTTSDIDDVATLVGLFKLMIQARDAQINQIEFPIDEPRRRGGYVTAADERSGAAVDQFLGEGGVRGRAPSRARRQGRRRSRGRQGRRWQGAEAQARPQARAAAGAADRPDRLHRERASSTRPCSSSRPARRIDFPILYPTMLTPGSAISDSDTREFPIDGPARRSTAATSS